MGSEMCIRDRWEADGAQDATQRAHGHWQKMLDQYEAPAMDPAASEALRDFVEQKKQSMPDANY